MIFHKAKIALISLLLSYFVHADEPSIDVIVYADSNYPPYSYVKNGTAEGIYYEIVAYAFSKMPKYNLIVKPLPWKRGLKNLESGAGVAIYPPYKHEEDRTFIFPYSIPLLQEELVVYCRDSVIQLKPRNEWPNDFYGLVFGVNSGFILDEKFQNSVAEGKISLSEATNSSDNLKMMLFGRIDCHINSGVSIRSEWVKIKLDEQYRWAIDQNPISKVAVISRKQGYLGFYRDEEGRYPFKKDLVDSFNRVVADMKKSGIIDEIVSDY